MPLVLLAWVPLLLSIYFVGPARAQVPGAGMPAGVFVGSELEDYLRTLQTLGLVRPYPWSIRGFSPKELDHLRPLGDAHPWRDHPGLRPRARVPGASWELVPARLDAWYNSAFPFGMNDGPVWRGRGLTAAVQAGASARWGPLSLAVAPAAFVAENRSFALHPNGQTGRLRFADPVFWQYVDIPQRFGEHAYGRLDPGQSTVRLDAFGVTVGLSTASQWWGPMTEYPYILGNNAGGFAHAFVGSSSPGDVWVGRLHGRVMYGRLEQSAYTDNRDSTVRFAAATILVFTPRGAPGIEIGATRFFHIAWPESGIGSEQLRKPFESLLKLALPSGRAVGDDNQLASVFVRWVLPRAGFEVYGEYGREDHNADTRDLILEPDHAATYGLGLRKVWKRTDDRITSLRAEIMNYQVSVLHLYRDEGWVYAHAAARQGHTHRGQLLGTGIGVGSGAGGILAVERYAGLGKTKVSFSRLVRQDPTRPVTPAASRSTDSLAVQHVLSVERTFSPVRGLALHIGGAGVYEFNRDLRRDAINVTMSVAATWWPSSAGR